MTFPEFSQKPSPRLSDGRIHHIVMPHLLQLMASRPGESHPHLSIGQTYTNLGKNRNKNHISGKKHDKTPRIWEKVSNIWGEIPALAHISPESIEKWDLRWSEYLPALDQDLQDQKAHGIDQGGPGDPRSSHENHEFFTHQKNDETPLDQLEYKNV